LIPLSPYPSHRRVRQSRFWMAAPRRKSYVRAFDKSNHHLVRTRESLATATCPVFNDDGSRRDVVTCCRSRATAVRRNYSREFGRGSFSDKNDIPYAVRYTGTRPWRSTSEEASSARRTRFRNGPRSIKSSANHKHSTDERGAEDAFGSRRWRAHVQEARRGRLRRLRGSRDK